VLSGIYVLLALVILINESGCGGGLDVDFCGIGSILITYPATLTVNPVLKSLGLELDYHLARPQDIVLQILNITLCALLVYLVGWGLGWIGARILRLTGRRKTPNAPFS
jgi:hypothetical protein